LKKLSKAPEIRWEKANKKSAQKVHQTVGSLEPIPSEYLFIMQKSSSERDLIHFGFLEKAFFLQLSSC
jgi:hypothetical protein